MNKKRNNKGFSLVELIVVIAIMAVLVVVLAPAYTRYVEKSRVQKDISAVGEVVSAIKVAAADMDVADELETATTLTVTTGIAGAGEKLDAELDATVGEVELQSKTLKDGVQIVVSVDGDGVVSIAVTAKGTVDATVSADLAKLDTGN